MLQARINLSIICMNTKSMLSFWKVFKIRYHKMIVHLLKKQRMSQIVFWERFREEVSLDCEHFHRIIYYHFTQELAFGPCPRASKDVPD